VYEPQDQVFQFVCPLAQNKKAEDEEVRGGIGAGGGGGKVYRLTSSPSIFTSRYANVQLMPDQQPRANWRWEKTTTTMAQHLSLF